MREAMAGESERMVGRSGTPSWWSNEIDDELVSGLVFFLLDPKKSVFDDISRKALYSFIDAIGCKRVGNRLLRYERLRRDLQQLKEMVDWSCNGDWEFVDSVLPLWLRGVDWLESRFD